MERASRAVRAMADGAQGGIVRIQNGLRHRVLYQLFAAGHFPLQTVTPLAKRPGKAGGEHQGTKLPPDF